MPIAVLSEVTIGKSNEDPTNDCAAKLYTSSGLYFFIVCEMFDSSQISKLTISTSFKIFNFLSLQNVLLAALLSPPIT